MNDTAGWQVARLDDIERRDRDIPVREHFGIRAFGVNAYRPGEGGSLIGEHDETGSGQEELYVVLDGRATFEIDGETVDAPAGTFVRAPPTGSRAAPAVPRGRAPRRRLRRRARRPAVRGGSSLRAQVSTFPPPDSNVTVITTRARAATTE